MPQSLLWFVDQSSYRQETSYHTTHEVFSQKRNRMRGTVTKRLKPTYNTSFDQALSRSVGPYDGNLCSSEPFVTDQQENLEISIINQNQSRHQG